MTRAALDRHGAPNENLVPVVDPHGGPGARPSTMLGTALGQVEGRSAPSDTATTHLRDIKGGALGWFSCYFAGFLLSACHEATPDEAVTETAVAVKVESVTVGSIREEIVATGLVTAAPGAELTVTAPEAARIAALPKGEGEHVAAGEILVRFDIPSLAASTSASQAAIDQAAAHVENARAAATRLEGLVDRGVAARKEAEDAAARSARSHGRARASRERTRGGHRPRGTRDRPRAICRRDRQAVAQPRRPRRARTRRSDRPARRSVPFRNRRQRPRWRPLARANERQGSGNRRRGTAIDAVIVARPVAIDPGNSTAPVRLKPASSQRLIAGISLRVVIFGAEQPKAVLVPPAAVIRDAETTSVMVVDGDSKAHRVEIETGITTNEAVEVVKGLKGGERVIVRGQNGLPDGAPVTVE